MIGDNHVLALDLLHRCPIVQNLLEELNCKLIYIDDFYVVTKSCKVFTLECFLETCREVLHDGKERY